MWKPIYDPGPWKAFVDRRDNKGLPLMEVRKKYMEEQLLFENYMSHLQQLDTLHTLNPLASAPSSAPSAAYGRDEDGDLRVFHYFNGTLLNTNRYYRSANPDGYEGTYRYRDTPNFSITCGFKEIYSDVQRGWSIIGRPCDMREVPVPGPSYDDGPTGVYGDGNTGPGTGYIVEFWN